MDANRVVFLGGLTYVVYGGLSLLSVGAFLPPIPFKPALMLIVALVALFVDNDTSKQLRVLFGAVILIYTLSNPVFWEMFFGHGFVEEHVAGQLDLFLLFAILLLFGFNFMFVTASVNNKTQRLILNIIHALALPAFIVYPSLYTLDIILAALAVFHVLIVYLRQIQTVSGLTRVYAHLLLLNVTLILLGYV